MEAETPPSNSACVGETLDEELDSTIHGFNASNVTVIERGQDKADGSDSGVELGCCCASSLQDAKDGSGSESSSTCSRASKRITAATNKKKVGVHEPAKQTTSIVPSKGTPRSTPRNSLQDRAKSKDRSQKSVTPRPSTLKTASTPRPKPTALVTDSQPWKSSQDKSSEKIRGARSLSSTRVSRTPAITPTDDGRWPSISKQHPPTRSGRGSSVCSDAGSVKTRVSQLQQQQQQQQPDTKYNTLPRRRRERSADNTRTPSRDTSVNRTNKTQTMTTSLHKKFITSSETRSLPPYPKKKTRIYAEVSAQTSLTLADVERLLAERGACAVELQRGELCDMAAQTESRHCDKLHQDAEALAALRLELRAQTEHNAQLQIELAVEKREKQALKEELERNMQRVQTILGNTQGKQQDGGDDSFFELESRFEVAGQVIIKQENEISELHSLCRSLQRELDLSLTAHQHLLQQQRELESESQELHDFLAAEKSTLCEALHEAEVRGAHLAALEARSRELLLSQGAAVSGAAVALAGLSGRINTLLVDLEAAYAISERDIDSLEEQVYYNEVYTAESPETPSVGTSFLSAIISAIRNAAFSAADAEDEPSSNSELLDSETEPCLMMDSVLEDVALPDTHSHNLVSASARHHNFSRAILQRQPTSNASTLVDQVIEADNLLTRLLKVLRIIQLQARNQDSQPCPTHLESQRNDRDSPTLSHLEAASFTCIAAPLCPASSDTNANAATAASTPLINSTA